ncbi:hypothetical protein Tco_0759846 [Tanacetum coccineum]
MPTFDVPQLLDSKGSGYLTSALKLEAGRFTKWNKRFLCHIVGMEPYLIKVLKDDQYVSKTTDGLDKPECQWNNDKRMVVNQDQCLKESSYHAYLMM